MYHSVPLNCLLNDNYKQFMMSFGPKVKHIIDCHETNDEVMARARSYNLHKRHSQVCPGLIPLSPVELKAYAKENQELLQQ